jgi:hypothetical protein
MLINDKKPLGTDAPLELDLLERELENGVVIEDARFFHEDQFGSMFGGLFTAQEHVVAREAHFDEDE